MVVLVWQLPLDPGVRVDAAPQEKRINEDRLSRRTRAEQIVYRRTWVGRLSDRQADVAWFEDVPARRLVRRWLGSAAVDTSKHFSSVSNDNGKITWTDVAARLGDHRVLTDTSCWLSEELAAPPSTHAKTACQ